MFCVSAPSEDQIRRFISEQRGAQFFVYAGRHFGIADLILATLASVGYSLSRFLKKTIRWVQFVVGESKKLGDD